MLDCIVPKHGFLFDWIKKGFFGYIHRQTGGFSVRRNSSPNRGGLYELCSHGSDSSGNDVGGWVLSIPTNYISREPTLSNSEISTVKTDENRKDRLGTEYFWIPVLPSSKYTNHGYSLFRPQLIVFLLEMSYLGLLVRTLWNGCLCRLYPYVVSTSVRSIKKSTQGCNRNGG